MYAFNNWEYQHCKAKLLPKDATQLTFIILKFKNKTIDAIKIVNVKD